MELHVNILPIERNTNLFTRPALRKGGEGTQFSTNLMLSQNSNYFPYQAIRIFFPKIYKKYGFGFRTQKGVIQAQGGKVLNVGTYEHLVS